MSPELTGTKNMVGSTVLKAKVALLKHFIDHIQIS
jgi:hypothetical protein